MNDRRGLALINRANKQLARCICRFLTVMYPTHTSLCWRSSGMTFGELFVLQVLQAPQLARRVLLNTQRSVSPLRHSATAYLVPTTTIRAVQGPGPFIPHEPQVIPSLDSTIVSCPAHCGPVLLWRYARAQPFRIILSPAVQPSPVQCPLCSCCDCDAYM